MDDKIFSQLLELTLAFNRIGLKPVICGGLGIYLCFHRRESEVPLRTTNDIDLILTKSQVLEQSRREAIAEIITGELDYEVCESGKHFQFEKANQQKLDVLAQPAEGIDVEGFRAKFVKSHLHGYITPEACFIEEDLRPISLPDILLDDERARGLGVFVPSPTNLLLLKLFAFDDRDEKKENDTAQTHAFDVYITVTLADRNDYLQG
jgi:Fe-S cluster assembly iron-binding protein IscA